MLFLLLLLVSPNLAARTTNCEELAFAVEKETTQRVKAYLTRVVADSKKLVELTHDFIDPLKLVDGFPWEEKMRDDSKPFGYDPEKGLEAADKHYTEPPEMKKLKEILFQNIKREDQNRPLVWYTFGFEPQPGSEFGAYFGLSQMNHEWSLQKGSYWLDSSLTTSKDDADYSGHKPDGSKMSDDEKKNNPEKAKRALRWLRWELDSESGETLYDKGPTYDFGPFPTTVRPWYKAGLAADGPIFQEPYQMVVGDGGNAIGIGVVAPLRKDGKKIGVVDAEFTLEQFSLLLRDQRQASGGVIYMFDRAKRSVMAISTVTEIVECERRGGERTHDCKQQKADNHHTNALVKGTQQFFTADTAYPYQNIMNSRVDGKEFYVYAENYNSQEEADIPGIDWVIVTVWEKLECAAEKCKQTGNDCQDKRYTGLEFKGSKVNSHTKTVNGNCECKENCSRHKAFNFYPETGKCVCLKNVKYTKNKKSGTEILKTKKVKGVEGWINPDATNVGKREKKGKNKKKDDDSTGR